MELKLGTAEKMVRMLKKETSWWKNGLFSAKYHPFDEKVENWDDYLDKDQGLDPSFRWDYALNLGWNYWNWCVLLNSRKALDRESQKNWCQ